MAENYNKPCSELGYKMLDQGMANMDLYINTIKDEAKELPPSRLKALEEAAKFLSNYAVESTLSDPLDENYKELDKTPVFDLLQRVTGKQNLTKEFFTKSYGKQNKDENENLF